MEFHVWYMFIGLIIGGIVFYKSSRDVLFDQDLLYVEVFLVIIAWPIAIIVWLAELADLD